MADNVTLPGTGEPVATDEVGVNGGAVAHAQYMKLVDGRANGTDGLPGDTSGLWVRPRRDQLRIQVTSAGLTNVTYAAGDQLGNQFELANAARVSGGTGRITSVMLLDEADVLGACTVLFFDRSVTPATDNNPASFSDADLLFLVGVAELAQVTDTANNRAVVAHNLSIPYTCNATSLFANVITRTPNGAIATATAVKLTVVVERD